MENGVRHIFDRRRALSWGMMMVLSVPVWGQTGAEGADFERAKEYVGQAGEYAEIYNGRLEGGYNRVLYKGLPYYGGGEYVEAEVVFGGTYYAGVRARLDLFRDQLVALSPAKQFGVVLDSPKVKKVRMHGRTFVWLEPDGGSGVARGFYMQLWEGAGIQLFGKERQVLKKELSQKQSMFYFDREVRYYLLYKGLWRPVKNKSAFVKAFPQHKRQINQFVREQRLNFGANQEEALAALAAYCGTLISASESTQNVAVAMEDTVLVYDSMPFILKEKTLKARISPFWTNRGAPADSIAVDKWLAENIDLKEFIPTEEDEEPHLLDEITVLAQRADNVRRIRLGIEKLEVSKLKNIPTAFGEVDILRVIQSLPGVKTVGEASTGYNVRGGATDQNLILLNDGTVYNPNHLFGLFTAFGSEMIKEAELYKSSIPAQYGGRISSVLDLVGKEANKEKFTGSAGLGLVTSRLALEVPIIKGRTSVLLSGRTTYSDWILKQLPEKSGYNSGTAGFYDLGTVVSHRVDEKNSLNIYGYYSQDRFAFSERQRYGYRNLNASLKWRRVLNELLLSTFAAGYDHYDYENTDTMQETAAYKLSFAINQLFAKADFTYAGLEDHTLNFGMKAMLYGISPGNYEPVGASSLVNPDYLQRENALESALYVEDQWNISRRLSASAGIRFSVFNALGPRTHYRYNPDMLPYESTTLDTLQAGAGQVFKTYAGPEFRLSARYLLDDQLSVKAGFNTMQQYIHKLSNTVIMSPTDTWKLSDDNIRPQKGWQAAAGLYFDTPKKIWQTSVEVYYKKLKDYPDYRSGAKLLMNHHIETELINTEGYAYGVELSLKKEVGKLNGWASYTYARTFLRQSDKLITHPVNDGDWYPTDYDKPHDFKLTGNYKFTQRYSCSVNMDYSTGRPTTLPAGKYYDPTINAIQVFYLDRNSYRIPDYFRLDLSFNVEPSHKLTLLTHSSISFGVYNVTGRKNAYSIYYVSEEGKINGYKLSVFGVPIPFITYNIKF